MENTETKTPVEAPITANDFSSLVYNMVELLYGQGIINNVRKVISEAPKTDLTFLTIWFGGGYFLKMLYSHDGVTTEDGTVPETKIVLGLYKNRINADGTFSEESLKPYPKAMVVPSDFITKEYGQETAQDIVNTIANAAGGLLAGNGVLIEGIPESKK